MVANSDVTMTVRAGRVHALVGENGAGKSTLMKILYGMQRPDEGSIRLNGTETVLASPGEAMAAGIGMVHQHFMLADNLTVAENIVIGAEQVAGIGARAAARISEIGARYGMTLPPGQLVERLGVGTGNGWRSSRSSTEGPPSSSSTSRLRCWCPRRSRSCSPICVS